MIILVHLSDIHLSHEGNNNALTRVREIKGAIQSQMSTAADVILLVSGDVTHGGRDDEYSLATNFINSVELAIQEIPLATFKGTAVIPGNHDCNFEGEGTVRPMLLQGLGDRLETTPSGDLVEQMLVVQKEFFEFEALISRKPHDSHDRLLWTYTFETSDGLVVVRSLNTAWLSRKKEVPNQLFYPAQLLNDVGETTASLVITMFHHPYGWLHPDNAKLLKRSVELSSDIVVTGHEHDGDMFMKMSPSVGPVNYVEGQAL